MIVRCLALAVSACILWGVIAADRSPAAGASGAAGYPEIVVFVGSG